MKIKKDIITLNSGKPGSTVAIIAGIHGNEICGLKAFRELIPKIKLIAGKVHFIYGNLLAIKKGVREIDMNMNRAFKDDKDLTEKEKLSYEYRRTQEIKPYLDESDFMLDIHSSNNKKSKRFVIAEPLSFSLARQMPLQLVSSGWSTIEPGCTDGYMNDRGKPNLCIECGYHLDPFSIKKAKDSLLIFLSMTGNINTHETKNVTKQEFIDVDFIYHTKTDDFTLARHFDDFEKINKGMLIGNDGQEKIYAHKDSYIIFANTCQKKGQEAFILGEETHTARI